MIARIWLGETSPAHADAYFEYINENRSEKLAAYREQQLTPVKYAGLAGRRESLAHRDTRGRSAALALDADRPGN